MPGFSADGFLAKVRTHLPVESRDGSPEDAMRAVEAAGRKGKAIAWSAGGNRFHVATFPELPAFTDKYLTKYPLQLRPLDVVLLHGFLLEQLLGISPEAVTAGKFVKYYKEPAKVAKDLSTGAIQAAFFMNAVTIPEFRDVSLSGTSSPRNTTFFYPEDRDGTASFPVAADDRVPGNRSRTPATDGTLRREGCGGGRSL